MLNSIDTLRAEVRYHQRDLADEAARARLGRAVRARRFRWPTSRDADRFRAEVADLIADTPGRDSPQWPAASTRPRRAEVR